MQRAAISASAPATYTLSIINNGTGAGTVTESPTGLVYAPGTTVTLTAIPAAGSSFAGWSGGANGTANSVQVTMNANTSVTATFNLGPSITSQPTSQTVNAGSNAMFSVSASSTGSLSYQWLKNGMPISGAINSTLTLTNVQSGDAATYSVEVFTGGNVYVADTDNDTIRKITPAGVVTTLGNRVNPEAAMEQALPLNFTGQWAWRWIVQAMSTWRTLAMTRFAKSRRERW